MSGHGSRARAGPYGCVAPAVALLPLGGLTTGAAPPGAGRLPSGAGFVAAAARAPADLGPADGLAVGGRGFAAALAGLARGGGGGLGPMAGPGAASTRGMEDAGAGALWGGGGCGDAETRVCGVERVSHGSGQCSSTGGRRGGGGRILLKGWGAGASGNPKIQKFVYQKQPNQYFLL